MLTRREFIAILMVMGALFFLFQFLNVMRRNWAGNIQNLYARKRSTLPKASDVYMPDSTAETIVYLGNRKDDAETVVADWARYQKWRTWSVSAPAELEERLQNTERMPKFIVVNLTDAVWSQPEAVEQLCRVARQGIHLVVTALPAVSVLEQSTGLRRLLGVLRIRSSKVQAQGVDLYEGFLMGGEKIYCAKTEKEQKCQDLNLEMPWLTLTSGTKVYMKAMLNDPDVDVQEEPPVIWRKSFGDGFVFVVSGDYFQGTVALGLLTAMLHETQQVTVYPVLNAQNLVVANAPFFADENNEVFQQRYSQSMRGVLRDILWSSISRVATDGVFGLSCMIAPQTDYSDENEPEQKDLLYYLRIIQTLQGEVGLSGWRHDRGSVVQKLKKDAEFWEVQASNYPFASFYRADLSETELREALVQPLLRQVQTVVEQPDGTSGLVDYYSDEVTRQKAVVGSFTHTYREDLRVKAAETALGYTSVLTDLKQVLYPEEKEDGWEKRSEEFTSNVMTYWKPFAGFARTTTAETDIRIRNFLTMQPRVSMDGKRVTLDVTKAELPVWFIVRTHDEELTLIKGGTFKELEPDVFLVELQEEQGEFQIGTAEQHFYTP